MKDNRFVLFHDWTLDCATNGKGEVRQSTFEQLTELDAGYGYTFDNSQSFPFRGKGYAISDLEMILNRYTDRPFWLNLKNNDEASFASLGQMLRANYKNRLSQLEIENGIGVVTGDIYGVRVIQR